MNHPTPAISTHAPRSLILPLAAALFMAVPNARAGEGAHYIPAYNELVQMIWSRCDLVGVSRGTLTLKDAATSSVLGTDIFALQNKTAELMAHFIQQPLSNAGPWNVSDAYALKAFPTLAPPSGASFLLIPEIYTDNRQPVRSTTSVPADQLPVLWEQFMDIQQTLRQMRYTIKLGAWSAEGASNRRSGQGSTYGSWSEAQAATLTAFRNSPPVASAEAPCFVTGAMRTSQPPNSLLSAEAIVVGSRLVVTGITNLPHRITFYAYSRTYPLPFPQPVTSSIWDAYDQPQLYQNTWTAFGSGAADATGRAVSPQLGPTAASVSTVSRWCDPPGDPIPLGVTATRAVRGFVADVGAAVIEWPNLYDKELVRPALSDDEEDGLVYAGCACTACAPSADPAWRDMQANPACRFRLGVSSGLTNGGLRVQAYITEWYEGGQPQQMLNLDTHARLLKDPNAKWEFMFVKRPSGHEVLFCLSGARAGSPIDSQASYRAAKAGTLRELQFAGQDSIVHVFGGYGSASGVPGALEVNEVRAVIDHHPVSVQRGVRAFGDGNTASWPGLSVIKLRSNNRRIKYVNSPLYSTAAPQYALAGSDLITSVTLTDAGGAPAGGTDIAAGSRIFNTRDAAGTLRDKVRIAISAEGAEIWRYGAQADPAQQTFERLLPDAAPGTLRVRRTVITNPGQADAHSNVLERVLTSFPWGHALTAEVAGPDSPDPQVTRYSYFSDPADTNSYARRRLIETPDGGWTRFDYDAQGRTTTRVEPFGDSPADAPEAQCRVTRTMFAGDPRLADLQFPTDDVATFNDHRPRLVIETTLGHEVARTYYAYLPDRVVTKRATEPGTAYTATSHLTSVRQVYTNGLFVGHPLAEQQEDGTCLQFSYAYDAARQSLTTTRAEGAAGADGGVTNGTRTVTVVNAAERVLSERTQDVASGLTLSDVVYERDGFGRTTNTVDRRTGTITSEQYGCCGVERLVDGDGVETRQDFTALKQVFASTRAGITTFRRHDSWGNVVQEWQSAGQEGHAGMETRSYDDDGRMAVTTNTRGYGTRHTHDLTPEGGRRSTATGSAGESEINAYHRDGRPRATDGTAVSPLCYAYGASEGESWTIVYRGRDTNSLEWTRTTYDMLGHERRVEFPDGYRVDYAYDGAGRQIRQSDGFTSQLTSYDDRGEPFRQATDMNSNGVIDLDGTDRVTESRRSVRTVNGVDVHEVETRVYAVNGLATATVVGVTRTSLDGLQTWHIAFGRTNHSAIARNRDAATRTETHTQPDGTRQVKTYSNNLLVCEIDLAADGALVAERRHAYDAYGRLHALTRKAVNGADRVTAYAYDPAGQQTNITETAGALTRQTSYEFNGRGELVRQVLPDGGVVSREYGDRGELRRQSGARTYPVSYTYDEQGRLHSLSTYRMGFAGQPDTTTWEYEPKRGWLSTKRYADGSAVAYESYANGAMKTRTWARGVETRYAYDAAGVVTNLSYSDGTPAVSYTYDRLGRVQTVQDAAGLHQYTYTPDGSPLTESLPQAPDAALVSSYDHWGRRTNIVLRANASASAQTSYAFDLAGRLHTVSDGTVAATYTFGADGRTVTNTALGCVAVASRDFDGLDRLQDITTVTGTTVVHRSAYAYNAADQRTRQTLADGSYWVYRYDDLGQVISGRKTFSDGVPVGGAQFEYAYDQIGNRTRARNVRGQGTQEQQYTANALNQYVARTVPGEVWVSGEADADAVVSARVDESAPARLTNRHHAYFWAAVPVDNTAGPVISTNVTALARLTQGVGPTTNSLVHVEQRSAMVPQTPETFAYDADGNLTADGLWTYTWDAENRLMAMESLASVAAAHHKRLTFAYDFQGRRVAKTVFAATSTNTHTFIYDGWNVIAETTDAATNTYLWGLDLSGTIQGAGGIGGLLACKAHAAPNPQHTLYTYDGSGNVMALINTNGTTITQYEYGPFGEEVRTLRQVDTRNGWLFSTRYTETGTDLDLFPMRTYTTPIGRWLGRDPSGEAMGVNLYAFVENSSINKIDGFGLWSANVHYDATKGWCLQNGYMNDSAETVAKADEAVDSGSTSFMPIIGDQRYHFDRNQGNRTDSRIELYKKHLEAAKAACTSPADDPATAAKELGTALHPYQDWVAHGEYGLYDEGAVYTVHNKFSPQTPTWGDVTDYPDNVGLDAIRGPDGRPAGLALQTVIKNLGVSVREYAIYEPGTKRVHLTERMTVSTLKTFKDHVRQNGNSSCKCKSAFGIP
ncbi:MAG: hypothetical protein K8T26_17815 [Lentisphaerae bacterium]|nr:hypothetical protein [Lentisphaerota bacterium]